LYCYLTLWASKYLIVEARLTLFLKKTTINHHQDIK
jgi:hypothetical protein